MDTNIGILIIVLVIIIIVMGIKLMLNDEYVKAKITGKFQKHEEIMGQRYYLVVNFQNRKEKTIDSKTIEVDPETYGFFDVNQYITVKN